MLTNVSGIVGCSENQLWGSVVPRTNVADVWFARDKDLGGTEIAQLENTGSRVQKQVLGFDISVTDANRVNVR